MTLSWDLPYLSHIRWTIRSPHVYLSHRCIIDCTGEAGIVAPIILVHSEWCLALFDPVLIHRVCFPDPHPWHLSDIPGLLLLLMNLLNKSIHLHALYLLVNVAHVVLPSVDLARSMHTIIVLLLPVHQKNAVPPSESLIQSILGRDVLLNHQIGLVLGGPVGKNSPWRGVVEVAPLRWVAHCVCSLVERGRIDQGIPGVLEVVRIIHLC